jgi:hypothetical protein
VRAPPQLGGWDARCLEAWAAARPGAAREVHAAAHQAWLRWPERNLYEGSWTILPITFTIPPHPQQWIAESEGLVPSCYRFVKDHIPHARTALISRMAPGGSTLVHQGWAELANGVLRSHWPIDVEPGVSGVAVDGAERLHDAGPLLFDDSHPHMGFNRGERDRFVLLVDVPRPAGVPRGISTVPTTDALERFIAAAGVVRRMYASLTAHA